MAKEQYKPKGLIQNQKVLPKQSAETTLQQNKSNKKKITRNQNANIKVSQDTKNQLDILMKLTENKFAYEMIESLLDYYVDNALDADKKRAFKTLSNL